MNEAKVEALIEHITEGGSLEQEALAEALSLSPRSVKSIEKYLAEASDRIEDIEEELSIGDDNPLADLDDEPEPPEEEEEDEDEEEEEEPEPEPAPKKSSKKKKAEGSPYRFFLQQDNGTSVELEQVRKGGKVITFREVQPTDIVKLMLRGEIVEVDLIPLRKQTPSDKSEFGISNETLLNLALAARP